MTPRLLGQRHSLCASRKAKAVLDWDGQQYPAVGSGATADCGPLRKNCKTDFYYNLCSPNVDSQSQRKPHVT